MEILEIKKLEKNFVRFYCKSCDFKCSQKCDWDRHILRRKHILSKDGNNLEIKKLEKTFFCDCGKSFKTNSGLWKHRKKCLDESDEFCLTDKEIINALVHQNDKLMKIIENGVSNTTNNTTNIENKTFNLNLFLNETCKNAMNISDFVSSIQLNLDDLEHTGRNGYIEGITNIFIKNLNNLEKHMRPLHCSDLKREILYIKENNKWEKEIDQKPILTNAIKSIANKNIKQIQIWKDNYPDCTHSESNKSDLYLKIVSNSMSGSSQEECNKNYNKIIKNIVKESVILKC
jgi:hypothetical protein